MGHMPAIPRSTRSSITLRLLDHAEKHWPQLQKVEVTYRGSFAYAAGVLPGAGQLPLFRLRYGGSAHSFGFAIYSAARERYEDALLLTGYPTGTPQEALDTACTVHLAGTGQQPEPNRTLKPRRTYGAIHLGQGGVQAESLHRFTTLWMMHVLLVRRPALLSAP